MKIVQLNLIVWYDVPRIVSIARFVVHSYLTFGNNFKSQIKIPTEHTIGIKMTIAIKTRIKNSYLKFYCV